jgi:hypothetical protein
VLPLKLEFAIRLQAKCLSSCLTVNSQVYNQLLILIYEVNF